MSIGELRNEKWHRKLICPTCLKGCFWDSLREFTGFFGFCLSQMAVVLFFMCVLKFFMHVVCLFVSVCYTKTCVELAYVHACNGDLVFGRGWSRFVLWCYTTSLMLIR